MNFYTYRHNCHQDVNLIIEAASQSDADTQGASLVGLTIGSGHGEWTRTESDNSAPTVDGVGIAELVDGEWVSSGGGKHGQVIFDNGSVVSY